MTAPLPLIVRAPAKVNLCLYVGKERRPDGLHEICSLFQSVSLHDELHFHTAVDGADAVECPHVRGPNLVELALAEFRRASDWHDGPLRVVVEKRIPIAAGLGGGSADAAAALRALNFIAPQPLDGLALGKLAISLGADVPSQLSPGLRLVSGAGEAVERLERLAEFALVLLPSDRQLSTADVYNEADRLACGSEGLDARRGQLAAAALACRGAADVAAVVHNDLRRAAVSLEPNVAAALAAVEALGPLAVEVTGSGPTVFGIFESRAGAEAALAANPIGGALVVEPVGPDAGEPRPPTAAAGQDV